MNIHAPIKNIDTAIEIAQRPDFFRELGDTYRTGVHDSAALLSFIKDVESALQAEFVGTGYELKLWFGREGSLSQKPIGFWVTSANGMDEIIRIALKNSFIIVGEKGSFLSAGWMVVELAGRIVEQVARVIRNDAKYASRGVDQAV